jgi:hypothetical protein
MTVQGNQLARFRTQEIYLIKAAGKAGNAFNNTLRYYGSSLLNLIHTRQKSNTKCRGPVKPVTVLRLHVSSTAALGLFKSQYICL